MFFFLLFWVFFFFFPLLYYYYYYFLLGFENHFNSLLDCFKSSSTTPYKVSGATTVTLVWWCPSAGTKKKKAVFICLSGTCQFSKMANTHTHTTHPPPQQFSNMHIRGPLCKTDFNNPQFSNMHLWGPLYKTDF